VRNEAKNKQGSPVWGNKEPVKKSKAIRENTNLKQKKTKET